VEEAADQEANRGGQDVIGAWLPLQVAFRPVNM
jgi:hypothetical protein